MNIRKKASLILLLIGTVSGCTLSPGMDMKSDSFLTSNEIVIVDNEVIRIEEVGKELVQSIGKGIADYRIGIGDGISVTIWGLPEVFPLTGFSSLEQNSRFVDSQGEIYFPYAGNLKVLGLTRKEVRDTLATRLAKYFTDPQIDITISKFNSKKVYVLGEVTKPQEIKIKETPLSLADALGSSLGVNVSTAAADKVYIIRQPTGPEKARIFRADLKSPASFIIASNFILRDKDIIYVNATGTTKWNRVVTQFFPFSSFLNQIDNLDSD